jgi:hypothetical protein
MQEPEFEKLISNQPAKWAEMFISKSPEKIPDTNDPTFKLTLIPGESIEEQRDKIKSNEKPIPLEISDAIHKFVKEERKKGSSERAIRRAVKRKWNIYVV